MGLIPVKIPTRNFWLISIVKLTIIYLYLDNLNELLLSQKLFSFPNLKL